MLAIGGHPAGEVGLAGLSLNQANLEVHFILFLRSFWAAKDTSNAPPRLTLKLRGVWRQGVELDAIRRPKRADIGKMLNPACGAASRKVLITYIAQSQNKFVMQRCMSHCRAAGCRRKRRRSGRALFERASGPFFGKKNEKAFRKTQHCAELGSFRRGWMALR